MRGLRPHGAAGALHTMQGAAGALACIPCCTFPPGPGLAAVSLPLNTTAHLSPCAGCSLHTLLHTFPPCTGWLRPPSQSHPDTWDTPNQGFEAFVTETVQHRIGKYVQPDHPNRVASKDAHVLHK